MRYPYVHSIDAGGKGLRPLSGHDETSLRPCHAHDDEDLLPGTLERLPAGGAEREGEQHHNLLLELSHFHEPVSYSIPLRTLA